MESKTIGVALNLAGNFGSVMNRTTGSVKSFQNQLKHTQNNINSFKEKVSSGFGIITKKIAGIAAGVGMAEGLEGLAGEFASFYNLDPEESFDKIKSGISGETEPLKALGINMSMANLQAFALTQGIKKQYKEMSQAEQVQLRYNYLMSVSKDAQGDFNKTSSSFANQLRIAKTNLQQLGATIGGYVLPYLNKLLNGFNSVFDTIPKIIQGIKNFFTHIKGPSSAGDLFNPIMEKIDDMLFRFFVKEPCKLLQFYHWISA